eukprot:2218271-Lingulodinium_polyedra.AAC.1
MLQLIASCQDPWQHTQISIARKPQASARQHRSPLKAVVGNQCAGPRQIVMPCNAKGMLPQ